MRKLHVTLVTIRQFIADIVDARLAMYAGSLVYITLLSLVPTLALSFSILHALGIQNQLEPLLVEMLSPLGERSASVVSNIIEFVNNTNLQALGVMGVGMILYSGVAMVLKLEFALNEIWGVNETRSLLRRISYYLALLLLGPIAFFISMAFMASIDDIAFIKPLLQLQYFSAPYYFLINIAPFLIIIIALFAIYMIIPNHTVSAKSAIAASVIAAFSWKISGWLFSGFIVSSANYNIIYSSFAVVVLFIFWIYITWLIILAGAMVCAQIQFSQYQPMKSLSDYNYQQARLIRIMILLKICRSYFSEERAVTISDLIDYAELPRKDISRIIDEFAEKQLAVRLRENSNELIIPSPLTKTQHLSEILQIIDCNHKEIAALNSQAKYQCDLQLVNDWYAANLDKTQTLTQLFINER